MKLLFFCLRGCVEWISVGGLCTRYFCLFLTFTHVFVWHVNEAFCSLAKMSDWGSRGGSGGVKNDEEGYGLD